MDSGTTLAQFLEDNNISQDEYLKWRSILAKHNFMCIMRDHPFTDNENFVTFEITSQTGFVYRKKYAVFPEDSQIFQVLSDKWGYYDFDGITN